MVLVGGLVWRGGSGGGGGAGAGESGARGRDARMCVGAVRVRGVARVRRDRVGRRPRATRATSGRAHGFLRGHRRAALGRRRSTGLQPLARRHLAHVPGRRLPAISAQHHAAAALYRATRR